MANVKKVNRTNTNVYEYTVEGFGHFPFDMLRYDCAYPKNQSDVMHMIRRDINAVRQVTLRSFKLPTEGRWNSFGWKVT